MMKRSLGLLLALCPIGASAFFDGFEGNSLASYWYLDGGEFNSRMTFSVANSWITVTDVYGSGQPTDRVGVNTMGGEPGLGPFADFDFNARIGWQPGQWQSFGVGVGSGGPYASNIIGYVKRPGQPPRIHAQLGNGIPGLVEGSIPAPLSGDHEVRITRQGSLVSAYFNGILVVAGVPTFQEPITSLHMGFVSSSAGGFAPVRVDYLNVVPELSTGTVFLLTMIGLLTIRILQGAFFNGR